MMTTLFETVRWKDLSDGWLASNRDRSYNWPTVPLGAVLHRRHSHATAHHVPLGKITFSGELVPSETNASRPFAAEAGQIFWSKIRLAQGSVALVPPGSGYAVSNEYPTYEVDASQAYAPFVLQFLRSARFRATLAPTGNTSKARISPEVFERQEMPLPPLHTQQMMMDALQESLEAASSLRSDAVNRKGAAWASFESSIGAKARVARGAPPIVAIAAFMELERWDVANFTRLTEAKREAGHGYPWPIVPLQSVGVIAGGVTKNPNNRPAAHARPYLRVANVRMGRLDLDEIKTIDVPPAQMNKVRLEVGDILFVEGNGSVEEVGRSAMWNGEIPDCTHQNHLIRARLDRTVVVPEFALAWFNSGPGKAYFADVSRTTSGLNNLNVSQIRNAPLLLPPVEKQIELSSVLWQALGKAEEELNRSAEIAALALESFDDGLSV
jgi:type I restriction enzyme S subunit